jgi:BMFP domain-containing protein YqiC
MDDELAELRARVAELERRVAALGEVAKEIRSRRPAAP